MKFTLESDQLTVQLEGLEQLWGLKRRLQIPHYALEDVDYVSEIPSMLDYRDGARVPGTAIPAHFLAGTHHRHGRREFWYVKLRQPGVLTLQIKPETLKYDRVRLTCTPEIAQEVSDWWQEHK